MKTILLTIRQLLPETNWTIENIDSESLRQLTGINIDWTLDHIDPVTYQVDYKLFSVCISQQQLRSWAKENNEQATLARARCVEQHDAKQTAEINRVIAEKLGIPICNVRQILHRAVKKLVESGKSQEFCSLISQLSNCRCDDGEIISLDIFETDDYEIKVETTYNVEVV